MLCFNPFFFSVKMDLPLENLTLSNEEEDELVLDDGEIQDTAVSVELCLVGRFLTDQTINFNLMKSRMAAVWRPGKGLFVKDIGQGRFIFQFFHAIDLNRVFEGGPWSFGVFPLILHKLKVGEFPHRVALNALSFWIQVHDLPAGYISENIGRQLGNFIGKFQEYDMSNSSSVWRQYMRIRVAVDVGVPLKRCKKIKKGDGSSFVVHFKYERLQIFCFICGRLGHSESYCDKIFTLGEGETKREWGAWLKAADRRSLPLGGDKWLRTEEGSFSGQAAGGEETAARTGSRGERIFESGDARYEAENQEPNHGRDSGRNFESPENMQLHKGDYMHNSRNNSNSSILGDRSNYEVTPIDDRKWRRSEEGGKATNEMLMLEFAETATNSSESFLTAGTDTQACRPQ